MFPDKQFLSFKYDCLIQYITRHGFKYLCTEWCGQFTACPLNLLFSNPECNDIQSWAQVHLNDVMFLSVLLLSLCPILHVKDTKKTTRNGDCDSPFIQDRVMSWTYLRQTSGLLYAQIWDNVMTKPQTVHTNYMIVIVNNW